MSGGAFIERTYTVRNKLGLHARAASALVKLSAKFKSDIFINKSGQEVNGKSIMGILILAAAKGTEITLKARGNDAEDALDALGDLINRGFDEE